ncbi:MAG: LysR family transcriptional regulator [Hyphomicrobiales bacterium]
MDIQLLETFTDLMETQSFNQTAERLGITQSTVSHRIRTLETLLGQRLFDRSRAGTHPTIAGDRFLEHARALTMEWREAVRHVSMAKAHHRVIRLGMHHDIASSLIGAATQQLRTQFSQTAFCLGMDFCAKIAADLLEGNLDFGLLFTPQDSPDLHITPLGELPYKMISNAAVHLDQVSPEHYVFPDVSSVFSKTHRQFLPQFTDAPLSCRPSASIAALTQTVPATSYLPLGAIPPHGAQTALHVVVDAPTLSQPIYAATHIRNRHADIQKQMLEIFSKLLDRA